MHDRTRYTVVGEWDADAGVWRGSSPDIVGLNLEAPTLPDLLREASLVVPHLMAANGQPLPESDP